MIYAIISDIHANKDALEKVLADAKLEGAERIVCLGDIVGYGPEPQEALLLLKSEDAIIVAGTHDDAVSGRIQSEDFIDLAHDAVMRHKEALSQESLKYLSALPYVAEIEGAIITHGDFLTPEKFGYIESEEDAKDNFHAMDSAVAFVGHTHIPEIFLVGKSGTVYKTQPQDFTIEEGKRYIINPGSVGYPRESGGQCHSSYVLYDSTAKTVEFRFLPFAVSSVMQKGIAPRRISKGKILAIAMAVALAAAAGTWLFMPKEEITITNVAEDPQLFIDSKTIPLSQTTRFLKPNLILDKSAKSAPVDMTIRYLDESGSEIGKMEKTVKSRATAIIEIPRETLLKSRSAEITLRKQKAADIVTIKEFAPAVDG